MKLLQVGINGTNTIYAPKNGPKNAPPQKLIILDSKGERNATYKGSTGTQLQLYLLSNDPNSNFYLLKNGTLFRSGIYRPNSKNNGII